MMATRLGMVKKTSLKAYSRPRVSGINAISINEGDELIDAKLTNGNSEIMLAVKSGYAIRFEESKVRNMGRTAAGVRGISLSGPEDEVVGMVVVTSDNDHLLVVSEKGFGKQTPISDYRITNRGGKGVKTLNLSDRTGSLIKIKQVEGDEDLMIITRLGVTIRINVGDVSTQGRNTQGVKLIRLRDGDDIASVAKVMESEEEDERDENP